MRRKMAARISCSGWLARCVGSSSVKITQRLRQIDACAGSRDLPTCLSLFSEALVDFRNGHTAALTAQSLSAVLFLCEAANTDSARSQALTIVRDVLQQQPTLWSEASLVMALRLYCGANDLAGASQLLAYFAGQNALKHRMLAPFIKMCHAVGDVEALQWSLQLGHQIPLTTEDFELVVQLCSASRQPLPLLNTLLHRVAPYLETVTTATAESICRWVGCEASSSTMTPSADGRCALCGEVLRGFPYTSQDRDTLLSLLEQSLTPAQSKKFDVWRRFVEQPSFRKFNVLLDGANIGYFDLPAWYGIMKRRLLVHRHGVKESLIPPEELQWTGGRAVDVPVYFELLDTMIAHCRARGMEPLVLLHTRNQEKHNLLPEHAPIVERWRREGCVFFTPSSLNDDLCWLYAALRGCSTTDQVDGDRREMFVVTNDCMRDHHFQMLHGRAFATWRDRHTIRFSCSFDKMAKRSVVHLHLPPPYTMSLQHDPLKRGWHIPVADGAANLKPSWLCVH